MFLQMLGSPSCEVLNGPLIKVLCVVQTSSMEKLPHLSLLSSYKIFLKENIISIVKQERCSCENFLPHF